MTELFGRAKLAPSTLYFSNRHCALYRHPEYNEGSNLLIFQL